MTIANDQVVMEVKGIEEPGDIIRSVEYVHSTHAKKSN